ncbi:MAG: alkaline phosphatase [Desulfobulbales bacterium]|nr:alkaline phosphatase [Desulfobulbales bacterium]
MLSKLLVFVFNILLFTASLAWAEPKNIIFLIGDGMGFEQVKAAGIYSGGAAGNLIFETFPHQAEVTTYSASSSVTDSAAAATAMATGYKVNNGVISMEIPGSGAELDTLLELCRESGKSTGLVSTAYITHATPAAFGAHENNRNNLSNIAADYLQQTRPNLLLGGGGNGMTVGAADAAGYTVVTTYTELQGLDTGLATMVSGQFGTSHLTYEYDYFMSTDNGYDTYPHLSEMTETALDILDNDPQGFFLMVESGRIDHAGHNNQIERNIFETLEFNDTVQVVFDWAQTHPDSLIIVTADHETGGLTVLQNNGQGQFPDVSWTTTGHTGINVPVYAWGENAALVSGILDNTELFEIATASLWQDYYCDSDDDGVVSSAVSVTCSGISCVPPGCQTYAGSDCNDADPDINPNMCDIKGDNIDQDCNGKDRTKGRACPGSDPVEPEICDDGIDNDNDGKTDCADKKDCRTDPAC